MSKDSMTGDLGFCTKNRGQVSGKHLGFRDAFRVYSSYHCYVDRVASTRSSAQC